MNVFRQFTLVLGATASLALTSCDKVNGLVDTAKGWISDEEKAESEDLIDEVTSVNKAEGEEIIANESRLVIVEYYSDT